jgi:hypothetical protein
VLIGAGIAFVELGGQVITSQYFEVHRSIALGFVHQIVKTRMKIETNIL